MTHPFLERLASGVVLSDGAMGTMLYDAGVQLDDCFDELNLTNPALVGPRSIAPTSKRVRMLLRPIRSAATVIDSINGVWPIK